MSAPLNELPQYFGRHESTDTFSDPLHRHMIGRDDQRRRLTEFLRTHGTRSAILVTGQRGAGKTAFVSACVAEYEKDVRARFLRSNAGRSFLWDRLGLIALGLASALAGLACRGLCDFLLNIWAPHPNPYLSWAVASPFFLLPLFPIYASVIVLRHLLRQAIVHNPSGSSRQRYIDYVYAFGAQVGVGLILLAHHYALTVGNLASNADWISAAAAHYHLLWDHPDVPLCCFVVMFTLLHTTVLPILEREAPTHATGSNPDKRQYPVALRLLRFAGPMAALVVVLTSFGPSAFVLTTTEPLTQCSISLLVGSGVLILVDLILNVLQEPRQPLPQTARSAVFLIGAARGVLLLWLGTFLGEPIHRKFTASDLGEATLTCSAKGMQQQVEELPLVPLIVLVFVLLARLEHDFLVRRPARGGTDEDDPQRMTLFRFIYGLWLPVLTVRVNLGVDSMDHRIVVQSMLTGLRDEYRRRFASWRSPLTAFSRALFFAAAGLLSTVTADYFFAAGVATPDVCDVAGRSRAPGYGLLCNSSARGMVPLLHFNLFERTDNAYPEPKTSPAASAALIAADADRKTVAAVVLPSSVQCVPSAQRGSGDLCPHDREPRHVLELRVHHVLVFALSLALLSLFTRLLPMTPHRRLLMRMSATLAGLSGRLTSERSVTAEFPRLITSGRRETEEVDRLDPRTVELQFLDILREIEQIPVSLRFADAASGRLSVPTPEIVFVFDELDKLSGSPAAAATLTDIRKDEASDGIAVLLPQERERRRTNALRGLLSDMKNILSGSAARFVFIGGRNLHDEWLADQSARQPLLPRIFAAEIYLESFIVDRVESAGHVGSKELSSRVREYLAMQRWKGLETHRALSRAGRSRWLLIEYSHLLPPAFVSERAKAQIAHRLRELESWEPFDDLACFLTYRSLGNVKRLKELFESYLRPTRNRPSSLSEPFDHDAQELHFDPAQRHRVRLIADLYHHLARTFEGSWVWRDDKIGPAVFYMSDFLLKFHRRAFSRAHLEGIDELLHVHRAPELRHVLHTIVESWTGIMLHPIRNGMYDYRFRSDVTQELRYLSRRSDEEMAALNFTLDESQEKKELYIQRLRRSAGYPSIDFELGLGELHELDGEYDLARFHYRRSISLIDERLETELGGPSDPIAQSGSWSGSNPTGTLLSRFLTGDRGACRLVVRRAHWAIQRIRLMLLIGMCHERALDYEGAATNYHNARLFARLLLPGLLHDKEAMNLVKHVSVLFQPVFAEAWVAEKRAVEVDASLALLEAHAEEWRASLPFVEASEPAPESPGRVPHATFALTMAEIHDKIGDLLFHKGRMPSLAQKEDPRALTVQTGKAGYLKRAHHHYWQSLRDVMNFCRYRISSAETKLGGDVLDARAWPDFVVQVAAGALADLGESLLASLSIRGLADELGMLATQREDHCPFRAVKHAGEFEHPFRGVVDSILSWIATGSDTPDLFGELLAVGVPVGETTRLSVVQLLGGFDELPSGIGLNALRVVGAFACGMAAARLLKHDGRTDDAARELLQVAETSARLLHWLHTFCNDGERPAAPMMSKGYWDWIYRIGDYAQARASRWLGFFSVGQRAATATDGPADLDSEKNASGRLPPSHEAPVRDAARPTGKRVGSMGRREWWLRVTAALLPYSPSVTQGNLVERAKELLGIEDEWIYPMVHRVFAKKVFVDIGANDNVLDLFNCARDYDGRLRVTESDVGITIASVLVGKTPSVEEADIVENVMGMLNRAEESFSMRATYYDLTRDLYYLYDDFNDRRVHYNRACDMASADLIALQLARLRKWLKCLQLGV